ncbi:MAG TPA: tRNA(Met) cytidine acetyltransferase, partial [Ignisphaera sp.]|nr:tRNA(Met) cytidine acetyltransferase [Ignisphaera sp.]
AINLIEKIGEKPRKPKRRISIILIADRGRGKSCAIGISLAGIIMEFLKFKNRVRIGVTAPALSNVQPLMNMALKALETVGLKSRTIERNGMIVEIKSNRYSIEYWEPSVIPYLGIDIAIVDEAAGIPVPLLHKIWKSYTRTIFATTIHGYEGAGRGFSVRFMKRIKEDPETELHVYEMEEPIRYGKDDPVEKWQFRVLLLDAEPDELDDEDLKYIEEKKFEYLRLEPEKLFTKENEKLLRSLFGIYVLAHYRNEPDDLGMMADAPHHSIRALKLPSGKIVAAAQLAEEGPIPFEYLDSLLRGGKIPGNIIPDRLLKHARLRDIGNGRGWRIVRIAVHPSVQGRGIGSYLLKILEEESKERGYTWIGSGFGATEELLRFWIKNGFIPVHISPDRNPVSAEYTVLVIKPLDERWSKIVEIISNEFRLKVLESLHDTYRDLEIGVAHQLLSTEFVTSSKTQCKPRAPPLTPIQIDRLLSYYEGYMTYESCTDILHILARHYWKSPQKCRPNLSEYEERILILKVLQGLT